MDEIFLENKIYYVQFTAWIFVDVLYKTAENISKESLMWIRGVASTNLTDKWMPTINMPFCHFTIIQQNFL